MRVGEIFRYESAAEAVGIDLGRVFESHGGESGIADKLHAGLLHIDFGPLPGGEARRGGFGAAEHSRRGEHYAENSDIS